MFLEDLGLTESGLEKLIAASYRLLGLISYPDCRRNRDTRMDHQGRHQSSAGSWKDPL